MHYVYLIQSIKYPTQIYFGYTSNLKQRFKEHNSGKSIYTAKHRPWKLVTYLGFASKTKALEFEKYLKSHSGRAFSKKRFW
jgi:putative endonuclease